jgi:hypothetical protein
VADSTGTAAGTTTAHCTITNSNPGIPAGLPAGEADPLLHCVH